MYNVEVGADTSVNKRWMPSEVATSHQKHGTSMEKHSRVEFSARVLQGCVRTTSPLLFSHQDGVSVYRHK